MLLFATALFGGTALKCVVACVSWGCMRGRLGLWCRKCLVVCKQTSNSICVVVPSALLCTAMCVMTVQHMCCAKVWQ